MESFENSFDESLPCSVESLLYTEEFHGRNFQNFSERENQKSTTFFTLNAIPNSLFPRRHKTFPCQEFPERLIWFHVMIP